MLQPHSDTYYLIKFTASKFQAHARPKRAVQHKHKFEHTIAINVNCIVIMQ